MLSEKSLERLLNVIPHNQTYRSPIPGLVIHHSDRPFACENVIQQPSICIVLNGEREVRLGEQRWLFDPQHFMFCPVDVPLFGTITRATPEEPFVVLSMRVDLATVRHILLAHPIAPTRNSAPTNAFAQWPLDAPLQSAFKRLLLLHESPDDISFLAPLIQQEIHYRLLTGEQGEKLAQMAQFGSNTQKIAKATHYLQTHFREAVSIETLAALCGMSLSSFHSHFKQTTTLSPLQYQKSLRLMEAKRLIIEENAAIAHAAYQVGYESPSQFSREYKRYFGTSPSAR